MNTHTERDNVEKKERMKSRGLKTPISQEHTETVCTGGEKSGCLARKKKDKRREGEELDMKVLGWDGMR